MPITVDEYIQLDNLYSEGRDELMCDLAVLTDKTVGRLDILVMQYYGDINYLPIVMDWNNITDITETLEGQIIKLPIIDVINKYDILEDSAPGVMDNWIEPIYVSKTSSKTGTTRANPKLNINQSPVKYDPETGNIVF